MGIWTVPTAATRVTVPVSSGPLLFLVPCSVLTARGALLDTRPFVPSILDVSAPVQLSELPPHPFITSWDQLPRQFLHRQFIFRQPRTQKNNFRSNAVYFTQPTGEEIVSSSVPLCKVALGAVACAPQPSLVLPRWPLAACGGRRDARPDNSDRSRSLAS